MKKTMCALLAALMLFCCGCAKVAEMTTEQAEAKQEQALPGKKSSPSVTEGTPSPAEDTAAEKKAETPAALSPKKVEESGESAASGDQQEQTPSGSQPQSGSQTQLGTQVQSSTGKTCTLSISCSTVLNNMDQCKESKKSIVPSNGTILSATTVSFSEGETVFDVLKRVCQNKGISLEFSTSPAYNSAYIEGIANLYEFDVGSGSGWMYKVNGSFPNFGCSEYTLQNGDSIVWVYTCDLGSDVGGSF